MKNKDNQESDASWLLKIPDELKLQVFKNLSPKDLSSVSETCHQLNSLIKDPRLWTELTVDLSESRRSVIWKVKKCPWLNTLKVTNKFGLDVSDKRHSNMISSLDRRAPHLKRIHFFNSILSRQNSVHLGKKLLKNYS